MAVTQNQVVDIIYNAVQSSIGLHFDSTARTQPQGLRLFYLIKQGIVNGVITLATIVPIQPGTRTDPIPVEGEIPNAETPIETRETLGEKTIAAPI